jgi:hypothetical protein
LEINNMARVQPPSHLHSSAPLTQKISLSPRQRHSDAAGGVAPSGSTTARECIVEARRIVEHFVRGTCSESVFCSVIERSCGHERWALLRVLKDMLGNAASSEEHCQSLLLVCGHSFVSLDFVHV